MDRGLFWYKGKQIGAIEFQAFCKELQNSLANSPSVAVKTHDPILINAALISCRSLKKPLFLLHEYLSPSDIEYLLDLMKPGVLLGGESDSPTLEQSSKAEKREPMLCIPTSGTTGRPKLAFHEWEKVEKPSQRVGERLKGRRWYMAYSPTAFAGLQVFFSAWNNEGVIYYGDPDFRKAANIIAHKNVEVISATPTFWRMLIVNWPGELPRPRLLQATLGGEAVRQDILDNIRTFFKPERITHVYASTEAGSTISVSDGLEGVPSSWLERKGDVEIRIRDGHLEIKSANMMKGYLQSENNPLTEDGWIRTPDLVELMGNRIYFRGREDGIINIGGNKISPEIVEGTINSLAEVADSVVYARSSPIVGSLVAADVQLKPGAKRTVKDLKEELRGVLPAWQIPQYVRIVDAIGISESGKKRR